MGKAEEHFGNIDPLWRAIFSGEAHELRRGRNFFKLISPGANARCRICFAPFEGIAAPFVRWHATGHGPGETPWLSIGIGVHTGKAFVGSLGVAGDSYEFAVLGDTMNLRARMASAASGGEIVLSGDLWPHVAGDLSAEPRTLELKGVEGPVQAYVSRLS